MSCHLVVRDRERVQHIRVDCILLVIESTLHSTKSKTDSLLCCSKAVIVFHGKFAWRLDI